MYGLHLTIDGMTCAHCVHAVNSALSSLDGVRVDNVTIGGADVRYDRDRVSVARILDTVNDEGYMASAEPQTGV